MKRLIVFTGTNCKSCHSFIAKLRKHNIPFTEISTNSIDGAAMAAKWKVRSLPTSLIGGTTYPGDMPINKIMEKIK